jgi:hypothetical protein
MPGQNEVPNGEQPDQMPAVEAVGKVDETIEWETTVTQAQVMQILHEAKHPTEDPAIAFAKVLEQYPELKELMKEDYYARPVRGILNNLCDEKRQQAFGDKLPRFLEMIGKTAQVYKRGETTGLIAKQELDFYFGVSGWTPPAIKKYITRGKEGIYIAFH